MYSFHRLAAVASSLVRNRRAYSLTVFGLQLALYILSGICAFLLRFEFKVPQRRTEALLWAMMTWLIVKPVAFHFLGAVSHWRFFSTPDLLRLLRSNLIGSGIAAGVLLLFCPFKFPHSVLLIDLFLSVLFSAGLRILTRLVYESAMRSQHASRQRTLIYGAGEGGVLLLQEGRKNSKFPYVICGFIDDRKHKGLLIQGMPVLGSGDDLKQLVADHDIAQILIAIPSADGAQMRRISSLCQAASVSFRTMPPISEILSGCGLTRQIRDVAVEDVLGRMAVYLDTDKIRTKIEGKIVLVTGAAGSIGSELCRQIARYRPAALVAFDLSETALFYLEREMHESFPDVKFCPEVGNIQNIQRLRDAFRQHSPSLVLHAAAFKHVPMMEKHMFEAVENNIFGTYNLGLVSSQFGVRDFVMISSDKAVHPTNIMGATKRVAEILIRSLQNDGTRYVSVRFGNVLGSNGSVVPIFKKQISEGGPVTITHPDMQRYFMTIPEAAQLVLQACTMGRGGEIFVLDMGKPVKIVDLARQLIRLSGLEPDQDIAIEFTGMRPGEKLFEELNVADEDTLATHHEKIKIFAGNSLPVDRMSFHLQQLRAACRRRDARLLLTELKTIVPDYTESRQVLETAFRNNLYTLGEVLEFPMGEYVLSKVPMRTRN
jgi:FlaA1/EpsC-like NDP-sugar epimerase